MDKEKKLQYQKFPNENGALTKEAAKNIRAAVAQVENEINEIIEETNEKQR